MSGMSIIIYTLLTARRDKLYIGLIILILIANGIAFFLGYTALSEEKQMTIAYLSSASRIIISTGIILFICFHIKKMKDNKELDLLLTRPISRTTFIFFYWIGFVIISFVLIIPIICILLSIKETNLSGLFYWCCSIVFESTIMAAFALLASLILNSAVLSVIISYSFYTLSRMMGFFVAFGADETNLLFSGWYYYNVIMKKLLSIIASILPRLDMFGKSSWLIYGPDLKEIFIYQMQSLIYIPFILFIAIFDINKKQF
jgi:ABC-type transport system involved in multi-copper enzyme maturation permease subunit